MSNLKKTTSLKTPFLSPDNLLWQIFVMGKAGKVSGSEFWLERLSGIGNETKTRWTHKDKYRSTTLDF
jgi:hypothetical protein